jgi:predicted metal-dependent phosphoesterase TrpH
MNPIYIDLHIHTSDNPDKPNESYDLKLLIKKIMEFNKNSEFLLSLTDHNFINTCVSLSYIFWYWGNYRSYISRAKR